MTLRNLPLKDDARDRQVAKLRRELGPVVLNALEDDDVVEIMRNPDGNVWVERLAAGKQLAGTMPASQAECIVATVAAMHGTIVTHDHPFLECELPLDQSRFTAIAPPVVPTVAFSVRRKPRRIFTLADYVSTRVLSQAQAFALTQAVAEGMNILVAGGTGSGKTTLLNALVHAVTTTAPSDRLVIIEDTPEIQCAAEDFVSLRAVEQFSMQQCLRSTMRMRPERIIVGEVRGGEVMTLLKSWNTGHRGGLATVHANSAELALVRLQSLMAEAPEAANYPHRLTQQLIAEAINVVVHIAKDPGVLAGRVVTEIVAVDGLDQTRGAYSVRPLALSKPPPTRAVYLH